MALTTEEAKKEAVEEVEERIFSDDKAEIVDSQKFSKDNKHGDGETHDIHMDVMVTAEHGGGEMTGYPNDSYGVKVEDGELVVKMSKDLKDGEIDE